MNRRGFLKSILAAGVAPSIARAASLMPVRALISKPTLEEIISATLIKNREALAANIADSNALLRGMVVSRLESGLIVPATNFMLPVGVWDGMRVVTDGVLEVLAA